MKRIRTNNGKKGGNLVGRPHFTKNGKRDKGIVALVTDKDGRVVELEGGEVIINKEASKIHWRELSRINQSAGDGVAIAKPIDPHDSDPDKYRNGGTIRTASIEFNPNNIPSRWIISYAKKIKQEYPQLWSISANVYGNEAFENLQRVAKRGYWLDSEKWMYEKWRKFHSIHYQDESIAALIAMLKWCEKSNKGWSWMKDKIDCHIKNINVMPLKKKNGWKTSGKIRSSTDNIGKALSTTVSFQFMASGGVVSNGVEYNAGDTVELGGRKTRVVQITNVTEKWVIFNDLSDDGKRKDAKLETFIKYVIRKIDDSTKTSSITKPIGKHKSVTKSQSNAPKEPKPTDNFPSSASKEYNVKVGALLSVKGSQKTFQIEKGEYDLSTSKTKLFVRNVRTDDALVANFSYDDMQDLNNGYEVPNLVLGTVQIKSPSFVTQSDPSSKVPNEINYSDLYIEYLNVSCDKVINHTQEDFVQAIANEYCDVLSEIVGQKTLIEKIKKQFV